MIGLLLSLITLAPTPLPPITYIALESPKLMLYYAGYCPHSQRVLKYLNQIHKSVPMTNVENTPNAKEILKQQGGYAQVPCLFINGKPLYDDDAIIQWISQNQGLLDNAK